MCSEIEIDMSKYTRMFNKLDRNINYELKLLEMYDSAIFENNTIDRITNIILNDKYGTKDKIYNMGEIETFFNMNEYLNIITGCMNIIQISVLNAITELNINRITFDGFIDRDKMIVKFEIC